MEGSCVEIMRQWHKLVAEEINVTTIAVPPVFETEKGDLQVVYFCGENRLAVMLNSSEVDAPDTLAALANIWCVNLKHRKQP